MKNRDYNHIMIDLETLGTSNNSVIAAIGAVVFHPYRNEYGKKFYCRVDIASCLEYGLEMDIETIKWWFKQSPEAQAEIFQPENRIPILKALRGLFDFIESIDKDNAILWGNSARFDLGILENAYKKIYGAVPWKHWNERDVRTLVSFAPEIKKNTIRKGTHHNALDDCLHQIEYCMKIRKYLNI